MRSLDACNASELKRRSLPSRSTVRAGTDCGTPRSGLMVTVGAALRQSLRRRGRIQARAGVVEIGTLSLAEHSDEVGALSLAQTGAEIGSLSLVSSGAVATDETKANR